jgi:uncharacterized SAM-binding protein YcdF (DUF218 family)
MYDLLSRSLGTLSNPATLLAITILLGLFAAVIGYDGLALTCLAVSAAFVVLFGVLPTANWITFPLEARFAANPTLPDRVAGIVALGGMERVEQSISWGRPSLNDPGPIAALVSLGRRYPEAQLVFSGGGNARISEAAVARDFLSELGASDRSIIYEDRSRNTLENARLTHALVRPKPDELWIVVSQAAAMPRAMGVFRKAGWNVIAFPAGYLSHDGSAGFLSFDLLDGLVVASVALHEWIGLIVYWAMGYTDEVFPL